MNQYMELAIEKAMHTSTHNIGGPFGACIVDSKGNVVAVASNNVLQSHDPTGHAEVNAIRQASAALGTHDLSGCTLYATGYPCPMCLAAIMWANISEVWYGCTPEDAEAIGFRDDVMYEYIKGNAKEKIKLNIQQIDREECLILFDIYEKYNKKIY